MRRLLLLLTVLLAGCAFEGDDPGDCTDRADNDRDGLFDCEDDGCAGSPDCAGDDDDATDDDDSVDDDDAADDDDAVANVQWVESRSAVVDISAPNFGYDLATEAQTVTLEGVAREDVEVVSWETDQGASGTTTGVQAWIAEDIPLVAGDNTITITGTTGDGPTGTDVMVVSYSADVPFAGGLTLSTTVVTAAAPLQNVSASVLMVSTEGMTQAVVGPADEDGQLITAWALLEESEESPGQLTAAFALTETAETRYDVRAFITVDGVTGSTPPVAFRVIEQMGLDDAMALSVLADEVTQVYQDSSPAIDPLGARDSVVDWLLDQPGVTAAGTSDDDGYGLWWIAEPGIPFVMMSTTVGRGGGDDPARAKLPRTHYPTTGVGSLRGWTRSSKGVSGRVPFAGPRAGEEVIGVNTAIALAPYYDEFAGFDESIPLGNTMQNMNCPSVNVPSPLENSAADLFQFGDVVEKGMVVISSHGDSFFAGLSDTSVPGQGFGWNGGGGQVAVLTRHIADSDEILDFQDLLLQGHLAVTVIDNGIPIFAVLPSFFPAKAVEYGGPMPANAVVGMGTCRSAWNNTMASAFLNAGAGFYWGFTDYVNVAYAFDKAVLFWERFLLYQETTGEAWAWASEPWEPDDNYDPAYPLSWGGTGIRLGNGPLDDGGFEYGASEWIWETDSPSEYYDISGAIWGVDDTDAPEGDLFIHGMTEAPASVYVSWKQKWCPVPDQPVTVSFWWQVLTEDWDCNPSGDPNWLNMRHDRIEGNQAKWSIRLEDFCSSMDVQGDIMGSGWQFHSFTFTPEETDYPADQYLSFSIGGYDPSEWWGLIDGVDVVQ